ncbi:MAG TPA: ATP-binding protein, partial [Pyrinomonadaceae bacterium]|nr:ATP-binding protein [Pyrinomonadaceae bacterium]
IEPSITFREIHELNTPEGRVILFEIPAAPLGIPISWQGHYHSRNGESLASLGLDKQDEIRAQTATTDWTAQIVSDASIADLDETSLRRARDAFAQKYANRFNPNEISEWSDVAFLDRAKLTQHGQITRAAILLLGKPESAVLVSPNPAQLTWKLVGQENAYEHFSPPFFLNTTELFRRIRNIQIRILPADELFLLELAKYDQKIVLEALHNCIAHQDYRRNARILVTETVDRLVFENEGSFFEGSPDDYVAGQKTPRRYRNPFLTQAMTELNMIDTMGYGIHEMYRGQAKRYFPMPDFDLSQPNVVRLTIHGKIVDPAYTRLLIQKTDLPFEDIVALDRIQKRLPVDDRTVRLLRKDHLIEGRKPNLQVSAAVAVATDTQGDYIRTRTRGDFYSRLILEYLEKFGSASRRNINDLLWDELRGLNNDEKDRTIGNLLRSLRRKGKIVNKGTRGEPKWELLEKEG